MPTIYDQLLDRQPAAPGAAPANDNPYDAILDQQAEEQRKRLQAVLQTAVQSNPEAAASAQQLSRQTGLPVATVERNLEEVRRQALVQRISNENLQASSPVLARQLMDPEFAKLAHDDINSMVEAERTIGGFAQDVGVAALKATVGFDQFAVGLADLATGGYAGKGLDAIGLNFNETQKILDGMYSSAQQRANAKVQQADGFFNAIGAAVRNPSTIGYTVLESLPQMLGGAGIARGLLGLGAKGVAAGMMGPELPGILTQVLGKAAPAVAAGAGEGIVGAGSAAEQFRANNPDQLLTLREAIAATLSGVMTGGLSVAAGRVAQRLGIEDVDVALAGGKVGATAENAEKGLTRQLLESALTEGVLEELPQSAQEQMWSNIAEGKPVFEGVGNAAAMGLVAGAVTGVGFNAATRAIDRKGRATLLAELNAQRLEALNKIMAANKVLQRDPDAVQKFAEQVAEGGVSDFYVDAQVLMQSGLGEQLAAISPSVAEQLPTAAATGGTVRIPVAEYATRIAPTELAGQLVDHIRVDDPNGFSRAEAQEFMQKQMENVEAEVAKVLDLKADDVTFRESYQRVKTAVRDRLNELGTFAPHVNEFYAAQQAAYAAARASRLGVTPEQFYQDHLLRIESERGTGLQYDQNNRAAGWTEQRLNRLLKLYGTSFRPNNSQAYAVMMNPQDFLALTASEERAAEIAAETVPLDEKQLAAEDQEIYLDVDRNDDGSFTVVSHEGRHRMTALARAGVTHVPVVLNLGSAGRGSLTELAQATLNPQRNGQRGATVINLQPLSYGNREALLGLGGDDVLFQPFNGTEVATTPLAEDVTEIEVDGQMRPALNSEGKPIHWSEEGTRNFWRWFGNSKVVDDQGRPLVVYHGTNATQEIGQFRKGVTYFTDSARFASGFGNRSIYQVYLRIANPVDVNGLVEGRHFDWDKRDVQDMKAEGRDGVIVQHPNGNVYATFDATQIKSATGNTGAFDPNNPNILRQSANQTDLTPAQAEAEDSAEDADGDDAPEGTQAPVPESVDDVAVLDSALKTARGQIWNKGRDLKMAIQQVVQAAARAVGVNVGLPSPQTTEYLVRIGVKDALFALKQNPNAIGWYDLKTRQALAVMALVHPEIATDENARFAFTWALAVTSNGLKVDKNFKLAEEAYSRYKRDGRMPTDITAGQAQKAINDSLAQFNELVDAWGIDNTRRFMLTNFTVGEIAALNKDLKPGGEHTDVTVKGAAILGPKIGNGFFSNLYGNFDQLTMDRWLVRTWGRWTGTLIKPQPHQTRLARERLTAAVAAVVAKPKEAARLSEILGTPVTADANIDELAVRVQETSMVPADRAKLNESPEGLEIRKAGNSLAKYLDGQKEAPAGPHERKYIRAVFGSMLAELQTMPEYATLTMADLQAVLWYAEKRLYETAKEDASADEDTEGYSDEDAPDYANAAAKVARDKGVSDRKINNALKKEVDRGRAGNAGSAAGQAQQGGQGQPAAAGGFTSQKKRFFVGTVATHRARSNRNGSQEQSWTYGRAGVEGRGGARLLKALGVTYVAEWKPGKNFGRTYKSNGLAAPRILELAATPENAAKFAAFITTSKQASGAMGAAVYVYPEADYQKMRLFLAEDGRSGVAVKPDGDIVSVFSNGGAGRAMIELAVAAGGTKLDAFDTILPEFYSAHGFRAVSRLTWDDEQAPEGWNKQAMASYNNGQPDVVFMVYDPNFFGGYSREDGNRLNGKNAYTRAVNQQTREQQAIAAQTPRVFNQAQQGANRGAFNPALNLITLLQDADLSTFLHESAHYFFETDIGVVQALLAKPERTPGEQQIVDDISALLKWHGIEGTPEEQLATWNSMSFEEKRVAHERTAEAYEHYLFEGKAPSLELEGAFRAFTGWMKRVYTSIRDFLARNPEAGKLNDEIRQVFDRMLATDEQIRIAEAAREMAPLFATNEELAQMGLDPAAYQLAQLAATQQSLEYLAAKGLKDMKWLSGARGKELKRLQRDVADKRAKVRAEVEAEVLKQPIYQAIRWLTKGVLVRDGEEIKAEKGFRLNTESVKAMYPDSMLSKPDLKRLRGMTGPEGLEPDMVAEMFGFDSGDALIRAIVAATPMKEEVDGLTDQRMLETYGELTTQEGLEREADKAVHNELRARVLATESNALDKAVGRPRMLAKAAKLAAERTVARLLVKDVRPKQYGAAEAKAGRAAAKAFKAGDIKTAADEKRRQLFNNYAARAAYDALDDVRSILKFFRHIASLSDQKAGKSRNMDVVNAARAVLAGHGYGQQTKGAMEYLKAVEAYDPQTYAALVDLVAGADLIAPGKPVEEMTVEELRALNDELKHIWNISKRTQEIIIDGERRQREDLANELADRLDELGAPTEDLGKASAVTPEEERALRFSSAKAWLRRVEHWVDSLDASKMGIFRRYVFQPIKEAADRYRADKVVYLREFRDAFAEIASSMGKGLINAYELNYTFGKDEAGVGMNELLHAILHTGNESNKRKLLLGRGWAVENEDGTLDTSRWDAFLQRMVDEGVLTREHFDFAQRVWDLLEKTKPLAQKAHRDAYGKYFSEVTANEFTVRFQDGSTAIYRGGYVPAMTDSRIVKDAELKKLVEEGNDGVMHAFPGAAKGFTKARVEYNRPLLLDLRTLPQHIDRVLLFSHLEMPVRDAGKLLANRRLAATLNRFDPGAISQMLMPWLNRTARQQVTVPVAGAGWMTNWINTLRNRTSLASMFANVSNAIQQVTGFSLAAVKVKPKHLASAMASYMKGPKALAEMVSTNSTYMSHRMENEVEAMMGEVDKILLDPSAYEQTQEWVKRHQFFLQSAVDNVMGPVIWSAAYNEALEEGYEHKDAVRIADSVIRTTQGSTLPEDVSRIEVQNAFARVFLQFAGYFNMQANMLGGEFGKLMRAGGMRMNMGRGLYVFLFGFMAPAIVAELIAQAFRGGPGDDDKDGEYLDDWLMALLVYGQIRNATAFVPGAGQLVNSTVARFNANPTDDRVSTAPAVSMLEGAAGVPVDLYKEAVGRGNHARTTKDLATLITLTTGLPANTLARPISYLAGVQQGKVQPTSAADAFRGLVTGAPSPESRVQ